jgi:hypothetical protein
MVRRYDAELPPGCANPDKGNIRWQRGAGASVSVLASPADPGTLIVGTDRRLLVFREEAKVGDDRYGHLALSIPRRWAGNLVLQATEEWQTLTYAQASAVPTVLVARIQTATLAALVRALQEESYPSMPWARARGRMLGAYQEKRR